jgi:hypothetical protein
MIVDQIVFYADGPHALYRHREGKIKASKDLVKLALEGKLGICPNKVKKYYRCEASRHLNHITMLKRHIATAYEMHPDTVAKVRVKIKKLKGICNTHLLYDETTKKRMISNVIKLKRAVGVLVDEGHIVGYTILRTGYFSVTWWHQLRRFSYVDTIESGITYFLEHDPILRSADRIANEIFNDTQFCIHMKLDPDKRQGKLVLTDKDRLDYAIAAEHRKTGGGMLTSDQLMNRMLDKDCAQVSNDRVVALAKEKRATCLATGEPIIIRRGPREPEWMCKPTIDKRRYTINVINLWGGK